MPTRPQLQIAVVAAPNSRDFRILSLRAVGAKKTELDMRADLPLYLHQQLSNRHRAVFLPSTS
jgi:hypothetical protein